MTATSNRLPGFRADINGLRAWAVVAVILYHFGIPGFGGGFVGVDVFFVISGFLMTNLVVKGLESGTFSLLAFYGARTRRIVPALLVLCLVLLALGYFLLPPLDYKTLAKHALAAIGFFSNIRFNGEAGYFDAVSHEKWLLHTWSLSVEWQFYLLLPVIVLALWRLKPGRMTLIVAFTLCSLVSLAVSVVQTSHSAAGAFFLLPARAWEMTAGGLVFLLGRAPGEAERSGRYLELFGLALFGAGIVLFDGELAWPGWRALAPVGAALAILAARRRQSVWTANRLAQWLGDRAYSLYLWHWPIFVGLAYFEVHRVAAWIAGGLLLTVLLGDLSCRWVENPARRFLGRIRRGQFAAALAAGLLPVAGAAVAVSSRDGFASRFDPLIDRVSDEARNKNPRRSQCHVNAGVESPGCVFGEGERVIVLGDSHAESLVTGIAAAGDHPGVVQWTYSRCPYVLGMKMAERSLVGFDGYNCEGFIDWASHQLATKPKSIAVVLAARYAMSAMGLNERASPRERPEVYFSTPVQATTPEFLAEYQRHLVETACKLAADRTVYWVRPIPEIGVNVPRALARRLLRGVREDVRLPLAEYRRRNAWVWAAQDEAARRCGVKLLDPTAVLCDPDYCYGSRDLHPLYRDDNHLSEYGNKKLVSVFSPIHQRMNTSAEAP